MSSVEDSVSELDHFEENPRESLVNSRANFCTFAYLPTDKTNSCMFKRVKAQFHWVKKTFSRIDISNLKFWFSCVDVCEKSRPGLSQLGCWHDRQRAPLQDGDHSKNDPRLVPGFLRQRTGMFPKWFRRISVFVGSREIRLTWTVHPRCGTLSCWISGIVS